MGHIKHFDIKKLKSDFKLTHFFETGTFKGEGVRSIQQFDFEKIYSCEIIEEYVESLKDAIDAYDGEVIVHFHVTKNQDLEICEDNAMPYCISKISDALHKYDMDDSVDIEEKLYTIADYRRDFNDKYCNKVDVLMWGESDSLIPKQTVTILNDLHIQSL